MKGILIGIPNSLARIYLVLGCMIIILSSQSIGIADGRIEHHQITSKILADAGQRAERELSVYLPEEYDNLEMNYPVLYLIHGNTGTNRTFLGAGYGGSFMTGIHANKIVDKLIEEGKILPMIVVMPNMNRAERHDVDKPHEDYFVQEITLFVDTNYRTIPNRWARAISGHSRGGSDAFFISLSHPKMFSLAGGYGSSTRFRPAPLPTNADLRDHGQAQFPLRFFVSVGKNDTGFFGPIYDQNRDFVMDLEEVGLPYMFVEDNGDHLSMMAERVENSIIFFSEHFGDGIATMQPCDKLTSTWGDIRQGQ